MTNLPTHPNLPKNYTKPNYESKKEKLKIANSEVKTERNESKHERH